MPDGLKTWAPLCGQAIFQLLSHALICYDRQVYDCHLEMNEGVFS